MKDRSLLVMTIALCIVNSANAYNGRVVSSRHSAAKGAIVYLQSDPNISDTTDENGEFSLQKASSIAPRTKTNKPSSVNIRNNQINYTSTGNKRVRLELFTLQGRKVKTLVDEILSPGNHLFDLSLHTIAHQSMILREKTGTIEYTYRVTPYGNTASNRFTGAAAKPALQVKKLQGVDSLIISYPNYPLLYYPLDTTESLGTIVLIDSTRGVADNITVYSITPFSEPFDTIKGLREGVYKFSGPAPGTMWLSGYTDYVYAFQEGFYSRFYPMPFCEHHSIYTASPVSLDLDTIPEAEGMLTGVLFRNPPFAHTFYDVDLEIEELGKSTSADSSGRYLFTTIPEGSYTAQFEVEGSKFSFSVNTDSPYRDFTFMLQSEPIIVRAPNVYLYPTETTDISVTLSFPLGGEVVTSDPEYGNGWDVIIDTLGMIDDTIPFLFYEASLMGPFNYDKAWIISESNLEQELRSLMEARAFVGREIDDFIDYWMPVLGGAAPYFIVYPQDINALIEIDITPRPQSVHREMWLISSLNEPIDIPEPEPILFDRDGFTMMEWGVLLTPELDAKVESGNK
ncbi:hypothetical protein QA601_02665 [Chitinispirillales bacterium ANBcel5]|uniref:hypothetical protein n=1 Tax=Cellulosispirillum alkaliphilum TaxID=3039283 RepID=UPI002A5809C3|nr:hypothetical protein [Chitinispirillales bacterium ANBcel5]